MEKVPATQLMHADAATEYFPAAQLVHAAAAAIENVPAGHPEQAPEPVDEYWPVGQSAHTAVSAAEGSSHVEPAEHSRAPQQANWPKAQAAQAPLRSAGKRVEHDESVIVLKHDKVPTPALYVPTELQALRTVKVAPGSEL